MRPHLRTLALAAGLCAAPAWFSGCSHDDSDTAKTAESALGIEERGTKTTSKEVRDVTVIQEKKVVDRETGKVLSDERTETPVTVVKEQKVRTDIKVKEGTPQTTPR